MSEVLSGQAVSKKEKLEQIFLAYGNKMYVWAKNVVKDSHDAEDIVQNVFLNLAKGTVLDHFDSMENAAIGAYLAVMTRNTAINWYNKEKREKSTVASYLEQNGMKQICSNNIETFLEEICLEDLLDWIHRLPENYAKIIELKYVKMFTNKEIAEILSISPENVRKRLERARIKLKEEYHKKV